ncbi:hypothetical protein AVEN_170526-1 [Araneus ventricosus]|uniref:Uncharacterized protein n=1 Tax=Araneus ventricosus TaxID=182803 RepID=A0A4Y2BYY2_ARAVE|nr:hypothetical protein AVEN_170526-1 [Araneus ventricosus]
MLLLHSSTCRQSFTPLSTKFTEDPVLAQSSETLWQILSKIWPSGVHLQAFEDEFVFLIEASTKAKVKTLENEALSEFRALLNISGAYSTTSTASLQVIEGTLPLHIEAQMESILVSAGRLKRDCSWEVQISLATAINTQNPHFKFTLQTST